MSAQSLQSPGSIGGTGAWQFLDGECLGKAQKRWGGIFFKQFTGLVTVAEDSCDRSLCKQAGDVGGNDVADAAVGRADNVAACNDIPNRDIM